MQATSLILICVLFTEVQSARLSFNSAACKNYLKKFGTASSEYGIGSTFLSYTGDAAFVAGATSVQVNLRYYDQNYTDDKYFGLVQEDGKRADATCLDLKLFQFLNDTYIDPTQVTDLPFTASSNFDKKFRYLSFTINRDQFSSRLVQTSFANYYQYKGYYAVAYYLAGTSEVQFTYHFTFQVKINKQSQAVIYIDSQTLNQNETKTHTSAFYSQISAQTIVQWCSDASCNNKTMPDLKFNDTFYLRQKIITEGLTAYYLVDTKVYYVGDGLNKLGQPTDVINTVAGQVTFRLDAFVWSKFAIQVTSSLSTATNKTRRIIQSTTSIYDPANITIDPQKYMQLDVENGIAGSLYARCFNFSFDCLAFALSILFFAF